MIGKNGSQMWLSKPVYEALPYFYIVAGIVSLLFALYLNYSFWPTVCLIVGLASLVAGIVVWLKRRDFRRNKEATSEVEDL